MIFENAPAVIGHRGSGSGDVPLPGPEPIPGAGPEPVPSAGPEPVPSAGPEPVPSAGPLPGAEPLPGADESLSPDTVAENTIPSMLAALDAGASWIEIDVTRTADDDLVLRHDPTLPGGAFLIDTAAADSGLPRLVEVFDALPAGVPVDVDVKTILEDAVDAPSRRTGALLAPVLRREAGRRPLLVTSFDPSLLLYLQEELPGVPLGLLTWLRFPLWHGVSAAAGLGLQAIGVHTESCGFNHPDTRLRPLEHIVDVAHKAALEFVAWCPAPQDVHAYVAAGVDALVVNDVPGVVGALEGLSQ